MKREYRIGFKICLVIMALESVFWLIWWLIAGSLPTLPRYGHIIIWRVDMELLPMGALLAIWLFDLTHEMENPPYWPAMVVGILWAIVTLCCGWGLGLALATYIIVSVVMMVIFAIMLAILYLIKVIFTSQLTKRFYDWILR